MNTKTLLIAATSIALIAGAGAVVAGQGHSWGKGGCDMAQGMGDDMRGGMMGKGKGRFAMMLQQADADKDGALTKAELDQFATDSFAKADSDGDGMLSQEEMTAQMAEFAKARFAKRAEMALTMMDDDGDGKLSQAETGGMMRMKDKMFDRFDANGDGKLTKDELPGKGKRGWQ